MRPHLILLLTLPLLGASCINTSSTPPKPPPEMAPKNLFRVEWGPNGPEDNPMSEAIGGFTLAAYEVGLDSYGHEFRRLADVRNLENQGGQTMGSERVGPLSPLSKGIEVWAKDVTWNQQYGGRIFRLFYPTKLVVSPEGIPTLIWPREEEVTVEVVPEWPWGGTDPLRSDNILENALQHETTPLVPPGVYCLPRVWNGIGPGAWLPWIVAPKNWMVIMDWFDDQFIAMRGGQPIQADAASRYGYSQAFSDGLPHRYVVFVRDGDAPPEITNAQPLNPGIPHYNTWYRIFVKDFWGRGNDGSVTCDGGQAGFEEVTDPEEIALLNSYVENEENRPSYGSPMDPRLLPTPWR